MLKKHKYNAQSKNGKRSVLEDTCFNLLTENDIPFDYEIFKAELNDSFEYCHTEWSKKKIKIKCKNRKITYTPDFSAPNLEYIIEVKGFETESFKIKWKLFKFYIAKNHLNTKLYIVRNKYDIENCILELKELFNKN